MKKIQKDKFSLYIVHDEMVYRNFLGTGFNHSDQVIANFNRDNILFLRVFSELLYVNEYETWYYDGFLNDLQYKTENQYQNRCKYVFNLFVNSIDVNIQDMLNVHNIVMRKNKISNILKSISE